MYSVEKIVLVWPHLEDALDYKLYWDKGSHDKLNVLIPLANSTNGQTEYHVNYQNSNKVIGSDFLRTNGGTFKFWVSYTSKA